jgi:hypothetical protein
MSRQTTSTVSAMWANRQPGTRPRPRVWIAGLVAGLAVGLALSGVALACEPTPVNCGPIVFRPTGRPLELEIAVGGCSYDTQNFQVSVWVRLRGPGYSRTAGGNSDVGVTGREALVGRTRVTMLNPGQYGLYVEALAVSRYGGDACYTTGTLSKFATLEAAPPTPRRTPRPTPRPTARPTKKPAAVPTPNGFFNDGPFVPDPNGGSVLEQQKQYLIPMLKPCPRSGCENDPTQPELLFLFTPGAPIPSPWKPCLRDPEGARCLAALDTLYAPVASDASPSTGAASPADAPVAVVPPAGSPAPQGSAFASSPLPGTSTPPSWLPILAVGLAVSTLLGLVVLVLRGRAGGGQGPWICPACHSVNEAGAGRCYSCHLRKPATDSAEFGAHSGRR